MVIQRRNLARPMADRVMSTILLVLWRYISDAEVIFLVQIRLTELSVNVSLKIWSETREQLLLENVTRHGP